MLRKVAFAVDLSLYPDARFRIRALLGYNHCFLSSHPSQSDPWLERAGQKQPSRDGGTMIGLLKHLSNQTLIVSLDSVVQVCECGKHSRFTSVPGDRLVKNMGESCS